MKRIFAIVVSLLAVTALSAQEKERSYDEFNGHWFIGVQGGIGQTLGETSFGSLISPAAAVSFGYQFTPVWGLRAGISGWQAKGAAVDATTSVYKFNYLQGSVDVMVDLCGIAGYRVSRSQPQAPRGQPAVGRQQGAPCRTLRSGHGRAHHRRRAFQHRGERQLHGRQLQLEEGQRRGLAAGGPGRLHVQDRPEEG